MSNTIGSIGGNNAMMMQGMRGMKRPDPAQMADNLFSKLDASGQGYIQKSDLQTAFDKISSSSPSSSSSSSTTSNVDELFSKLDTNSDGKVTKQEFSDSLKKVAEELDKQFMSIRMNGGATADGGMSGTGGMPPPPQGSNGGSGFTKDELTSQLSDIGSSDSKRSSLIAKIVNNFDKADTDGDGKVSFKEAMAFDQSTSSVASSSASSSTSSSTSTAATSSTSTASEEAKLMLQIVKLMQAYDIGNDQNASNSRKSALSVTA
jgi:Ca2+-binding EF-hand superfamily protein